VANQRWRRRRRRTLTHSDPNELPPSNQQTTKWDAYLQHLVVSIRLGCEVLAHVPASFRAVVLGAVAALRALQDRLLPVILQQSRA
jgi:hypothetical protein